MSSPKTKVKRVVLAYSGGLDTSIILKWLQTTYGCEVVTFTADLGQGEELEPARAKAELLGVKPENIFIEDLREEFVRDFVFPMFRANAQYEGLYLLGTSIARPLIAKRLVEIARATGADAIAHGATGKGNDQVRFELSAYALEPDIKVIAPWREWEFASRNALIGFAEQNQIPIAKDKRGEAPFSTDANLLHISSEGKVLEDPALEVPGYVYSRTLDPEAAPESRRSSSCSIYRRLVGRGLGIERARIDIARHLKRGVLQHFAFGGDVQQVGVGREGRLAALVLGDRDLVLLGEGDQRVARGEFPFAPRRDHLDVGLQRVSRELETDLVVALAGRAMGDRVGAGRAGDLDQPLGDQRARDRGAEQIQAFVLRIGPEIGNTKSRTNSSRRSSMKMFSGLTPSSSALARAARAPRPGRDRR